MAIRVLIVDDSPVIIKVLTKNFKADPQIEIVGSASTAISAKSALVELKPDVLILDLDLPGVNGLSLLRDLMRTMPRAVVVFSAYTPSGSKLALEALSLGAFEVVAKPSSATPLPVVIADLKEKLIAGSKVPKSRLQSFKPSVASSPNNDEVAGESKASSTVIGLASSTGGTRCLEQLFSELPSTMPGILVVQHITSGFIKSLASRLSALSALRVKEAEDGELIEDGKVLLAPSGSHLTLRKEVNQYYVVLENSPPVSGHRPSGTVLFNSMAEVLGQKGIGGILTGMGSDGAEGLLDMKRAGAQTFAQDEASSVVFGMAKAAQSIGACNEFVSMDEMASHLIKLNKNK